MVSPPCLPSGAGCSTLCHFVPCCVCSPQTVMKAIQSRAGNASDSLSTVLRMVTAAGLTPALSSRSAAVTAFLPSDQVRRAWCAWG